jgi:hypothetical protein
MKVKLEWSTTSIKDHGAQQLLRTICRQLNIVKTQRMHLWARCQLKYLKPSTLKSIILTQKYHRSRFMKVTQPRIFTIRTTLKAKYLRIKALFRANKFSNRNRICVLRIPTIYIQTPHSRWQILLDRFSIDSLLLSSWRIQYKIYTHKK